MSGVDGIIAALKVVARDAKARIYENTWDPIIVNRWVHLLPEAETGCWKHLLLTGHHNGWASRNDIIAHAEATVAYLEANRKTLNSRYRSGDASGAEALPLPENTIEAEFTDITERRKKSKKLLKQLPFFRG